MLPQYLSHDIERVQKRVLSTIIFSSLLSYSEYLAKFGLDTLFARHIALYSKLFSSIALSPGHKLFPLLSVSIAQRNKLRRSKSLRHDSHEYRPFQAYIYQQHVSGKFLNAIPHMCTCAEYVHAQPMGIQASSKKANTHPKKCQGLFYEMLFITKRNASLST